MPALGAALGPDGVRGHRKFRALAVGACSRRRGRGTRKDDVRRYRAACHGPEGKGNVALGAPNLTDKVWLQRLVGAAIMETIAQGRTSTMPAHKDFLGEQRVHILAAYVYGLSLPANPALVQAKPAP
jgi:cytochrome c oxidase cbb3-type subunit 3